MASAYSTVPTPTVPPRRNPATTTATSMQVRSSRIDRPVRACSPVIRPSRGPGPNRAAMYRPVASPLRTTPPAISAIRAHSACVAGSTASVASMARPTAKTFETVPRPGRCRSGIHSSSTTTPTAIVTSPMVRPDRLASPWWSTPHGSMPRPAETSSAELTPYSARPP